MVFFFSIYYSCSLFILFSDETHFEKINLWQTIARLELRKIYNILASIGCNGSGVRYNIRGHISNKNKDLCIFGFNVC